MPWLVFLPKLSLLVTLAVNLIVLCHVLPAFRRTRLRAFLLITIACLLSITDTVGIMDTIYYHVLGVQDVSDVAYVVIRTLRWFSYFADNICWCIGIVLLARAAMKAGPANPSGNPGVTGGPPSLS